MRFDEYRRHDAVALAELVRSKQVSAIEVLDAAIAGVEALNPTLNAIVYKAYDEACGRAAQPGDGPFAGVPFLIKDLGLEVAGWPRTSGTRFSTDAPDARDSVLVERYRAAGLNLFGKTNTPEFGIPGVTQSEKLGACRNPWNPDHIAGGSSGGAASATAAGIVPMAHASDGLGSIRIPAACCGLVGMKINRDRNPQGPEDTDRVIGLAVDHVVSRTVRDSAALLDATGWAEVGAPYATPPKARPYLEEVTAAPTRLRIGWSTAQPRGKPIDPEVQAAAEATVLLLQQLGHEVVPFTPDIDWKLLYRAQALMSASNFSAGMLRRIEAMGREPAEDELGQLARRAYEAGKRVTGQQALWGMQQVRIMTRRLLEQLAPFDAFLEPVMTAPAPRVVDLDPVAMDIASFDKAQSALYGYTPPANFTGAPSISLPLAWSQSGLPIGLQFTGRYGDEGTLYRLAGELEQAQPWAGREPDLTRLGLAA